jgi:glycosyltransferase involved in cell wall biosynthesis
LRVFTPLQLPGRARAGFLRRWDEAYYTRQMRGVARRYPGRELILFLGNPWHVFLLDAFPEAACTVYHCSDNFPAMFHGEFRRRFEEREQELIRRADLVVCSHPSLVEKCRQYSDRVHYLEHAVDERFFRPEDGAGPCPADLSPAPRPRAGFLGSLDHLLDYDLLERVAAQNPGLSLVLIGPVAAGVAEAVGRLAARDNVYLLGPRPWAALPGYLWHLDAGLMPWVRSEWMQGASPLKLFEYLAAGLPVVSTPLQVAERVAPFVRWADTPEEFAAGILREAAGTAEGTDRRAQLAVVREHYTWSQRAEEFSSLVEAARAE